MEYVVVAKDEEQAEIARNNGINGNVLADKSGL